MSVTFGAGGSTRDDSYQAVQFLMKDKQQPTVAYIVGYGLNPDDILEILDTYKELGIESIFVIRGDKPKEAQFVKHPQSFQYASELIAFIKKRYDFTIGCAGYPEGHVNAVSYERDLEYLKRKIDNGAEYIVAQYFYDNQIFFIMLMIVEKLGLMCL